MKLNDSSLAELVLAHLAVETIQLSEDLEVVGWSEGANRYIEIPLELGLPAQSVLPALAGLEETLESIRTGQLSEFNLPKINSKANDTTFYYSLTVVAAPRQSTAALVCLLTDVTEHATLEQNLTQQRNELSILRYQLEDQNARLLELSQIKSAFVAMASHELRSPLSSIRGFLDLVLEELAGPLNEEQIRFLKLALNNVRRLTTLTSDLMDIERIESGSVLLDLQTFDLYDLAQAIAANFQMDLQPRNLSIVFDAHLKDYRVQADVSRVEQILTNFISNAVKYSPPQGQILISFDYTPENLLVTSVKDSGIGISDEDQKRLFQRFYRATNANTGGVRGNGLGLSIVRALVERHGGQVWVKSKLGQGSTFNFSLPRASTAAISSEPVPIFAD